MFSSSYFLIFLLAALAVSVVADSDSDAGIDRTRAQFRKWWPQYRAVFMNITATDCKSEWNEYLYGQHSNTTIDWLNGGEPHTEFVEPLVNCVMSYCSPYILYQLQSAQIILGLLPTILAVLGASSDETSLLAIIGKRPLLAMVLAAATPSIYTTRAFEYPNPRNTLRDSPGRFRINFGNRRRIIVSIIEYIVGLGALANVAVMCWELGINVVSAIGVEVTYLPALWLILGLPVHFLGSVLFRLKANRASQPQEEKAKNPSRYNSLWNGLKHIDSALLTHEPSLGIHIKWFPESKLSIAFNWIYSIMTVLHIIFGTILFSSLTFIGPKDATGVLARFVGSLLICRMILMYEVSIIRERYIYGLKEEAHNSEHYHCEQLEDCVGCGGQKSVAKSVGTPEEANIEAHVRMRRGIV
jgi:hypothetical protein